MTSCLIIDDDMDSREGYAEYLRAFGYRVETVADPRQALQAIARARPDVVLLDLQMPHLDGWELLRQIRGRARARPLPVIVISACVFPQDRTRAEESGCDAFLPKPCTPDDVLATIKKVLQALLSK